ncbi:MAG: hypothetical protein WA840_08480 [Caulobacteraceae bacterium]
MFCEGCEEAVVLGACSSQEEDQMEALLSVVFNEKADALARGSP